MITRRRGGLMVEFAENMLSGKRNCDDLVIFA